MILWVNLHGAFILGLALMGLYIVAESSRRLVDPENTRALSVLEIRKLVLTLALCGAATLANPEGIQLYDYVRTVVLDPGSQQLVAEWRPPRINDFLGFLLFYCPFLLGLLAFIHSRVRPDFTEMMLFFSFAILGLTAIRNAAWFSTITYPLLARYLPLVDLTGLMRLRRFKAIDRLFNSSGDPERESPRMRRVNGLVMAAAVLVLATQSPWLRPRLSGASLLMDQTPVGAADFIEQQGLTGRMFHSQVFGDYLMWRLWPQQKTFIDGRVHLFTMDFLRDYEATIEDPLATNVFAHWNIQYVLLHKTSGKTDGRAIRSMENSAAWKKIYEDEISVMFERIPASLG
jgi:hypothetical protein